jgi:RimJ/RimL family protein N-acetyltransferase
MVTAANCFRWLAERTGYAPSGDARCLASVLPSGRVAGMVVLDGWTPAAASMHVALEAPAACRGLLRESFRYLFLQAGREVARGEVRAGNVRSLGLARHLGFREVYRVQGGWTAGEDVVGLEMRRHECRWL